MCLRNHPRNSRRNASSSLLCVRSIPVVSRSRPGRGQARRRSASSPAARRSYPQQVVSCGRGRGDDVGWTRFSHAGGGRLGPGGAGRGGRQGVWRCGRLRMWRQRARHRRADRRSDRLRDRPARQGRGGARLRRPRDRRRGRRCERGRRGRGAGRGGAATARVSGFKTGIRVRGGGGNRIAGNAMVGNTRYGIELAVATTGNEIADNVVLDSGDEGIHVGTGADANVIARNEIARSKRENLYLLDVERCRIEANRISGGGSAAIYVKHAQDNVFADNEIEDRPVQLRGESDANVFVGNRLDGAGFLFQAYKDAKRGWKGPRRNLVQGGGGARRADLLPLRGCGRERGRRRARRSLPPVRAEEGGRDRGDGEHGRGRARVSARRPGASLHPAQLRGGASGPTAPSRSAGRPSPRPRVPPGRAAPGRRSSRSRRARSSAHRLNANTRPSAPGTRTCAAGSSSAHQSHLPARVWARRASASSSSGSSSCSAKRWWQPTQSQMRRSARSPRKAARAMMALPQRSQERTRRRYHAGAERAWPESRARAGLDSGRRRVRVVVAGGRVAFRSGWLGGGAGAGHDVRGGGVRARRAAGRSGTVGVPRRRRPRRARHGRATASSSAATAWSRSRTRTPARR